jgi:hypothetical protein
MTVTYKPVMHKESQTIVVGKEVDGKLMPLTDAEVTRVCALMNLTENPEAVIGQNGQPLRYG